MTTTLQPGVATGRARSRRRLFAGATLVLALAVGAAVVARSMVDHTGSRHYLSTNGWPVHGQGAYVLGTGTPSVSPGEQPVPIASLAKVMTAYLVLKHYPLRGTETGPLLAVGPEDVADAARRRADGQSVVDVRAGEELTERDALMAILLPSANNIAVLLARQVAGSLDGFVAEMNRTAHALGMSHTAYTDPSGFDAQTTSTALDQLKLALVVAGDETLAAMMSTQTYQLPVAGTVANTDALLGQDGFVGMKTGSDDAAGGCFMFRSWRHTDRGNQPLTGVVLGQPGRDLIGAGLSAARQLVDRLVPQAATP